MSTPPLVFIDTETDGVHPDRKVWEVAMIRRETGGAERSTSFYVEIDLSTADPFGLKVGGFYDRHPLGRAISGGPDRFSHVKSQHMQTASPGVVAMEDAALIVARWTHGAHLVGAVPNFDAEVLGNLLRDNSLTPSWHYHLVDVEAMAVGYLLGAADQSIEANRPGLPWKSDDLSRLCGVRTPTDDERHTAMGDAEWAKRWYDAMTTGTS